MHSKTKERDTLEEYQDLSKRDISPTHCRVRKESDLSLSDGQVRRVNTMIMQRVPEMTFRRNGMQFKSHRRE